MLSKEVLLYLIDQHNENREFKHDEDSFTSYEEFINLYSSYFDSIDDTDYEFYKFSDVLEYLRGKC